MLSCERWRYDDARNGCRCDHDRCCCHVDGDGLCGLWNGLDGGVWGCLCCLGLGCCPRCDQGCWRIDAYCWCLLPRSAWTGCAGASLILDILSQTVDSN